MPEPRKKRALDDQQKIIRQWILDNRGFMQKLSESMMVTPQFIRLVTYGDNRSPEIERELRAAGWPGTKLCRH